MNLRKIASVLALIGATTALAANAPKSASQHPASPDAGQKAALQDIQKTLGSVPSFFKQITAEALPGAWEEMKSLQLNPNTRIPPKYKELLGLAVAAQIPCAYCTYFHKQAAQLNGGNREEQKEAVTIAAMTRHWSTFLNGLNLDEAQVRKDFDQIFEHQQRAQAAGTITENDGETAPGAVGQTPETAEEITDTSSAEWAYQDMEKQYGFVPSFMRAFPRRSVAGAWKAWKATSITDTKVPAKYRDLISLGVSAQIPCRFCVYYDTKSAKANGATDQELQEAVALAASTRQWSTVLNGSLQTESSFRKEVDAVFKHLKAQSKKSPKQLGGQSASDEANADQQAEDFAE